MIWLTTGIEISAQPPGKKLTRLSLLSGGERALTAIVLLFCNSQSAAGAIFPFWMKLKPHWMTLMWNRFGEFYAIMPVQLSLLSLLTVMVRWLQPMSYMG